jgi:Arc/MetJ-type ribon-helix-helix transcriptional regulator
MDKQRLQVEFTPEAVSGIDELRRMTGISTRSEVIRNALGFLQWAMFEITKNDAVLLLEKQGRRQEVVFPFIRPSKGKPEEDAGSKAEETEATKEEVTQNAKAKAAGMS